MTAPSLGRPRPAEGPGARLATVLRLVDELDDVTRAATDVAARVEEATGLRRGELAALSAVADGARSAREVGRRCGQADDAAAVTTEALVRRGLLRRTGHPRAPSGASGGTALAITEVGRVVVQQAEGLRIRLLDSVVGALGPDETDRLRAAVQALTGVLDGTAAPRHADCRENDSRKVAARLGP
ncbi:hypothetical protein [Blastococcus sp. TF02A-26]|uniref:hypothetical protein n=1 Tax=Blastococcus sp. TF02A-26 TaxID=2250577 RepID=UPI000DEAD869|nr:hypothetical protein [Blastococcus sp. TF02A-26]RBY90655.1 hypothetical protein DQ240_00820 [Blastococcus sp. TF02A-26]